MDAMLREHCGSTKRAALALPSATPPKETQREPEGSPDPEQEHHHHRQHQQGPLRAAASIRGEALARQQPRSFKKGNSSNLPSFVSGA